ncbi:unnamed protein product [Lactuca virosa]|uniref:Uncharacterized protein n=1 Tax=Lactuca virosa TaxID=75947 RepID=A0AAU9NF69_9ASTR|nr:unnamed protein product [Lactuca virosa]
MVFNSALIASVATVSADVWQSVACISDRISSGELLDLVVCFPLQLLGRFMLCIWTCFCVPLSPTDSIFSYAYNDDDDWDSDFDSYMSSSEDEGFLDYDH